jgi:hypothetical protein
MSNECPNCGSSIDTLITSCLFCNSPLAKIDDDSLSDQDLVSEASTWYGLRIEIAKSGSVNDQRSFEDLGDNIYRVTIDGKEVGLSSETIESVQKKYKRLLLARASKNPGLMQVLDSLESDLESEEKRTRRANVITLGVAGTIVVGIVLFSIFVID